MKKAFLTTFIALLMTALGAAQAVPAPPGTPAPAAPPPLKRRAAPRAQATPEPPVPPEGPVTFAVHGGGAYLGIDTRDVTSDRLAALKLAEERGVEVVMVDKDAPAGKAGLREHDVVLSFNGQRVDSVEQLRRMIRETPPGRTVDLGISRDGQPMTVKVQLADRKKMYSARSGEFPNMVMPKVVIPEFDIPSFTMLQYSRRNGLMVENLTSQLGEYFGVKNGEGVLVRSVEKGSRGEAAGFKAGDVIVRVGDERVSDMNDWNRLMRRQKTGTVPVGIIRDRRQQTLSISVPERKSEDSSELQFSIPELNLDMEKLQLQLERVQPEIQRAQQRAVRQTQREMARLRPELERATREARRTYEREMQQYQREMERLQRELQREIDEE